VPFDLSDVMFVTTANLLDPVPAALKDRMEVIAFPGYIEEEKLQIAVGFLSPKQRKEHGLKEENLEIQPDALRKVIREYTREAGVRNLEREVATICRKVAKEVASGHEEKTDVTEESIPTYLGPRRFHFGMAEEKDEIGAATGLVYTMVGGDIVSVETTLLKSHRGSLTLTGNLSDVMKESAQAALSYVRSRASNLEFDPEFYERTEVHIHLPAGAVPKDGPSAGITMATAMASALTKRAVRKDVAMTGEITLRGKVLQIGGVKEKILAAHRAGIRTVILPKENQRDLEDVPQNVREDLEFKFVEHCDEVLPIALIERNGKEGEE
jgi:ATP-dependent Lon protease